MNIQDAKIDFEVAIASKEPREILRLTCEAAYKVVDRDDVNTRITMARFAALLVHLSEQADKITKKNLAIQGKLVGLSWALVALTFVLLVFSVIHR